MRAVGLLLDLNLFPCSLEPIATWPTGPAPPTLLMFIPMLLFTPPDTMELLFPEVTWLFGFPYAELLPTTDPAPNLFGCLLEFIMFYVFIALE